MKLRPYQEEALEATVEKFEENNGLLMVMATGLGKTVTLAHLVNRFPQGKILVIAHREELIHQLANTLRHVTSKEVGIEMADWKVSGALWAPRVVVATVQSLARNGCARLQRLVKDPDQWVLSIVDEAHHVPAQEYQTVLEHLRKNPSHKTLGVTATPDRLDRDSGGSLAVSYDEVSYEMNIRQAIDGGWLVPIRQRTVYVEDLDYTNVRRNRGDLSSKGLREILGKEKIMHKMVSPSLELIGDRQAIFYAANRDQGKRVTEIFNRNKENCARYVDGTTPKDERRIIFDTYKSREFQVLVNVNVAVEGFDCPEAECIILGRKTLSRSWYAQAVGRGLRPLPGLVDQEETPSQRKAAIQGSRKTHCEIIDFHGNAGKHKLIWVGDILGGTLPGEVMDLARELSEENIEGEAVDPDELIEQARIEAEEREKCRRAGLVARAKYKTRKINPFDRCDLGPDVFLEDDGRSTLEQCEWLAKSTDGRIDGGEMTKAEAQQVIREIRRRDKEGLWTIFQEQALRRAKLSAKSLTREQASKYLQQLANSGFKRRFR
tara:strand:- start:9588 stop:11231 length:1644 start_codon:yes stop_codon:yes gene_type:complete